MSLPKNYRRTLHCKTSNPALIVTAHRFPNSHDKPPQKQPSINQHKSAPAVFQQPLCTGKFLHFTVSYRASTWCNTATQHSMHLFKFSVPANNTYQSISSIGWLLSSIVRHILNHSYPSQRFFLQTLKISENRFIMRSRGDQLLLTAMPQQVLLTFGHFQLPPTQHFGGTCSSALGLWIGRDRKLLRHTDRSYNHFSRIITPVEMSFCTSFLIEFALPATHFTPPRWGFRGSNSPTIRRTRDDHSDSDNLRTYAQRKRQYPPSFRRDARKGIKPNSESFWLIYRERARTGGGGTYCSSSSAPEMISLSPPSVASVVSSRARAAVSITAQRSRSARIVRPACDVGFSPVLHTLISSRTNPPLREPIVRLLLMRR